MIIYKTAKFPPVWTTILKIRRVFVHQTLPEHVLFFFMKLRQLVVCRICMYYDGRQLHENWPL